MGEVTFLTRHRHVWLSAIFSGTLATFSFMPRIYAASNRPAVSQRNLSLMASGSVASNGSVKFQASLPGSTDPHMLYQFWLESEKGWSMIQDYSSSNMVRVPLKSGSYIAAVYGLTQSQFDQHQWSQAQIATAVINAGSQVQLSLGPSAVQEQGVSLKAHSTNLIDPVYQFWIENPNGQWTSSGGYQSSSSFRYVPPLAGTYRIIAYAKDRGAPNNGKDSVWSRVERMQAAPTETTVATIATHLDNPLPLLHNSHALLLGQSALVSCSIKDDHGNPLVDVPVEFTLTNDSNPSDHVSLPQGLNDTEVTNAQGTAESVLSLTNPENGYATSLAMNSGAIARITYQVTVPSAPGVAATNSVLFGAVQESGTAVANATGGVEKTASWGSPVYHLQYAFAENIDQSLGKPLTLKMPASFILPVSSNHSAATLQVHDNSQDLEPLETWSPKAVTIPEGFTRALLKLSRLNLPQGSVFKVTFTPKGKGTPYVRTISGPISQLAASIPIPPEMTGGTLSLTLSTPSLINSQEASGVNVTSLTWHTLSGSVVRVPVPPSDTAWQAAGVNYSVATDLNSSQAQKYLGSYYQSGVSYHVRVPVYPEVGDGVISEVMNHHTVSDFLVPSVNNGNNQNVLTDTQKAVPVAPKVMDTLPKMDWGSPYTVSSTQSGGAEFVGRLAIPGTHMAWPLMHSYAAFVAGSGLVSSYPSSWALAGQSVVVRAQVTDRFGNPAPWGTPVQWSVPTQITVLSRQGTTDGQGEAKIVLEANGLTKGLVSAKSPGYQVKIQDKDATGTSLALKWLPLRFAFTSRLARTYDTSSAQFVKRVPTQTLNASQSYEMGIQVLAGNEPLSGYGVEMDNKQGQTTPAITNSHGIAQWKITTNHYPAETWNVKSVSSSLDQGTILALNGSPDAGQGPVAGFPELKIPLSWQSESIPSLKWNVPPPALAAVGAKVPFTVLAKNADGNPLVNDPISFSLWGQKTAALNTGSVSTNAEGLAQVWVSGGQAGEEDTLEASSPKTTASVTTPLSWLKPLGVSQMVPLTLSLNAAKKPNILTVSFSRSVDPNSVLSNGSQFVVKNPHTGMVYQVHSLQVQGSQVALTLSNSNPDISAHSGIQVAVTPVTYNGITSIVSDTYQQAAPSSVVTAFAPSAPEIQATAQNGNLNVTVSNHGASIPSGQSVVIMPGSPSGSLAGLSGGEADVLSTSGVATLDSWKIPYQDQGAAKVTYVVSFDGKTFSVTG